MRDPRASDQMMDEWIAWRAVCYELEHASAALDINTEDRLHASLVLWGESLAALRREQDPEDCEQWIRSAHDHYKAVS